MIYMDHAATTMLLPQAQTVMKQYELKEYANPSGNYPFGKRAKKIIEKARENLAYTIGANATEIFFTSGGSEADNWTLKGIASSCNIKNPHIITSAIEHSAILNSCKYLEKLGCRITYVPVDEKGVVNIEHIKKAICKDTVLISVMMANNEIGTIQPIDIISKIAHENNILFHTDAVQAYCHIPIDVKKQHIDLMSVSAHKCNGPKGIGFLYINNKIDIDSFVHGGSQEGNKRAGTENVAAIAGFEVAASYCSKHIKAHLEKEKHLNQYMSERLLCEIPDLKINGDKYNKLSNNINCTIKDVNAQSLIYLLGKDDICISAGSACHSNNSNPSHVLIAIGLNQKEAFETIRITLGPDNSIPEIDYVVCKIKNAVFNLRKK